MACVFVLAGSSIACGQTADDNRLLPDSLISDIDLQEIPTVSRYYFVHQYLSVIAPEIDAGYSGIFEDITNLNSLTPMLNGFRSPYTDEDISVETFEHDGKLIYVWQLPEPQHLREALYVAFFPYEDHYRAVAISIGMNVDWEISTSDELSRHTYGRVRRPDSAKDCMEILIQRNAMGKNIDPGEFFQEGYKCPESDY
ncbi:MAG: hypothetical protein K2I64_06940 [Muribaculaceae bacterium]|nr:hypothetical protein [Muribaculaceae bacterium]